MRCRPCIKMILKKEQSGQEGRRQVQMSVYHQEQHR